MSPPLPILPGGRRVGVAGALAWAFMGLAVGACDEPRAPTPTAPIAPPAPPAAPAPPTLDELAAPGPGGANLARPDNAYEVERYGASFGRDTERALVVLEAPSGGEGAPKIRFIFHGPPTPATFPVVIEGARGDRTNVVSVAFDHLPRLRAIGGELVLTAVGDDELVGTLDAEVRDSMNAGAQRLRVRFYATRERFYDAQLDYERAIRTKLQKRR